MPGMLSAEEVATLIRARRILKEKQLPKDLDVKAICEMAGVSRKTGYQWAESWKAPQSQEDPLAEELARLNEEHEALKKRYRVLEIDNEGHRLAWEIHGVDELLAEKKSTTGNPKRKRR